MRNREVHPELDAFFAVPDEALSIFTLVHLYGTDDDMQVLLSMYEGAMSAYQNGETRADVLRRLSADMLVNVELVREGVSAIKKGRVFQ